MLILLFLRRVICYIVVTVMVSPSLLLIVVIVAISGVCVLRHTSYWSFAEYHCPPAIHKPVAAMPPWLLVVHVVHAWLSPRICHWLRLHYHCLLPLVIVNTPGLFVLKV